MVGLPSRWQPIPTLRSIPEDRAGVDFEDTASKPQPQCRQHDQLLQRRLLGQNQISNTRADPAGPLPLCGMVVYGMAVCGMAAVRYGGVPWPLCGMAVYGIGGVWHGCCVA